MLAGPHLELLSHWPVVLWPWDALGFVGSARRDARHVFLMQNQVRWWSRGVSRFAHRGAEMGQAD